MNLSRKEENTRSLEKIGSMQITGEGRRRKEKRRGRREKCIAQ